MVERWGPPTDSTRLCPLCPGCAISSGLAVLPRFARHPGSLRPQASSALSWTAWQATISNRHGASSPACCCSPPCTWRKQQIFLQIPAPHRKEGVHAAQDVVTHLKPAVLSPRVTAQRCAGLARCACLNGPRLDQSARGVGRAVETRFRTTLPRSWDGSGCRPARPARRMCTQSTS